MGEAARALTIRTNANANANAGAARDRDPTRTVVLRSRWAAEATRRFAELRRAIVRAIVERDVLGLKDPGLVALALSLPQPRQWAPTWGPGKQEGFMSWLREQEKAGVLEVTMRPGSRGAEPWSNVYVRSAGSPTRARPSGRRGSRSRASASPPVP